MGGKRLHADNRPRIYLTRCTPRPATTWRLSPTAVPRIADTPGAALDDALEFVGTEDAVIILEGRANG